MVATRQLPFNTGFGDSSIQRFIRIGFIPRCTWWTFEWLVILFLPVKCFVTYLVDQVGSTHDNQQCFEWGSLRTVQPWLQPLVSWCYPCLLTLFASKQTDKNIRKHGQRVAHVAERITKTISPVALASISIQPLLFVCRGCSVWVCCVGFSSVSVCLAVSVVSALGFSAAFLAASYLLYQPDIDLPCLELLSSGHSCILDHLSCWLGEWTEKLG